MIRVRVRNTDTRKARENPRPRTRRAPGRKGALMERSGRNQQQPAANAGLGGKERVDGSSPSEGSANTVQSRGSSSPLLSSPVGCGAGMAPTPLGSFSAGERMAGLEQRLESAEDEHPAARPPTPPSSGALGWSWTSVSFVTPPSCGSTSFRTPTTFSRAHARIRETPTDPGVHALLAVIATVVDAGMTRLRRPRTWRRVASLL